MKILVIGPSWIGDMMMSHSLYRTLKVEYSSIEIDVMAVDWCRPLLARMPEIHKALPMPLSHGRLAICKRLHLAHIIRANQYDQAYILPNSFKSALVPFFANIPKRTGWRGEMRYYLLNDIRILDQAAFPLMIQRYVALAYDKERIQGAGDLPQPLLWPHIKVSKKEISKTTRYFNVRKIRPMIGLFPGAEFGRAKCWPHYHYATLAERLIRLGYQILLLGSKKDHEVGAKIHITLPIALSDYCINLTGKTQLEEAVVLIAACQGVVSNDSGLMHIAAALIKPMIALYGPSTPDFTPPLSHKARVIRLITGHQKVRQGNADQGYSQSLIDIQPDQVLKELKLLLDSQEEG